MVTKKEGKVLQVICNKCGYSGSVGPCKYCDGRMVEVKS